MPAVIEFVVSTAVIPTITALVVAILLQRMLPKAWATRSSLAFAAAAGCVAGYALLPDWAPLLPQRHWQWIHYLTLAAAAVGSLAAISGLPRWGQAVLLLGLGLLVAWQVVPTWETLKPSRNVLIPALATYSALLAWLLISLPGRLRGRTFCALLAATATATTLLVTIEVSLRLGHASAVAATSLVGCYVAAWSLHVKRDAAALATATIGLVPVFTLASVGFAFAGAIEPSEPAWILLLAPAAPLLLWLFVRGPLSRLQGVTSIVVQTLVVAAVPLAIGAWLLLRSEPADEWSASVGMASLIKTWR